MKKLLLILALATSVFACKQKETKPEGPSPMEQVMAVHDELMPKMSTIGGLISKLEATKDSTQADSVKLKVIHDLKGANNQMMTWMMDFGNAFETDEVMDGKALSEEKMKTLEGFQKSVNELKVQMNSAIEAGEKVLELEQ